jgi:hypothetical protein
MGALPGIEPLSIKLILQAFDDLVALGLVKNRLIEIQSFKLKFIKINNYI